MPTDSLSQLRRDEGESRRLYYLEGIPHIGIGHNLKARAISKAAVEQIFHDDYEDIEAELLARCPLYRLGGLSAPRRGVLMNMAFAMGVTGVLEFHHLLDRLAAGDYAGAATEITNSTFGRDPETRDRAARLEVQMRDDVWV